MDGVVTGKLVEVGQIVQPRRGLMMLVPPNAIRVTAEFKETQLASGNLKGVQRIPMKLVLDPISGGDTVLRPGMNLGATIVTK